MTDIVENYVTLAIRTESVVLDINDLNLRLLHASLGLGTEIIELNEALFDAHYNEKKLDIINLAEEVGDIYWYSAIACDVLGINFEDTIAPCLGGGTDYSVKYLAGLLESDIGKLLDKCKRHIFYRKKYDHDEVVTLVKSIVTGLGELSHAIPDIDWDIEEILTRNIEKLRARYPEKYTDYHAINRDLETERQVLEA